MPSNPRMALSWGRDVWDRTAFEKACQGIAQYAEKYHLPIPVTDNEELLFPGCDLGDYLGAGHYGVVYPTEDKEVVFKLTSDESEAHFIQLAINLRKEDIDPPGIVRYDAVVATKSKRAKFGKVYAIWRENAIDTGLEGISRDANRMASLLREARVHAHKIWITTRAKQKSLKQAAPYWDWLSRELKDEESLLSENLFEYRNVVLTLKNDSLVAYYVADAMEDYLYAGIVLADLHAGNVGFVRRTDSAVITDPGRAVTLKESLSKVNIETV